MSKVTLICPLRNEEDNLQDLFNSILEQTKKPDEIIFIEDSSTDGTFEVLKRFSKSRKNVKVFQVNNKNISKNKNFAIKKSKGDIIFSIDAGCAFSKDYIEKMMVPFEDKNVVFAGGISKLLPKTLFEKCFASFVIKKKLPKDYLPKGHAMAFRKSLWGKVGGFPEHLARGAEDTYFGKATKRIGVKPAIVREAVVYWENRSSLKNVFRQFGSYGYWDGKAFSFWELPRRSKLAIFISVLFPIAILHSMYRGIGLMIEFRSVLVFFYGVGIGLAKLYGYFFGLIGIIKVELR